MTPLHFKIHVFITNIAIFFCNGEWIWADSAYPVQPWCVSPYKRLAADHQENKTFNFWVSHVHIQSEHAVGYLKGRFSSLKGLWQQIDDEVDHRRAVEWICACIVIHTLILSKLG
ncbi:hypothetical protein K439DRAFT_1360336 [Ramaria rubella]|nr:hypothetical protein K439DRAFT_1360336 [Ramaria rubella]